VRYRVVMPTVDLDRYLARVGGAGWPVRPDFATLAALQAAHALSVPFENLDIQMGRRIDLSLEALCAKLVDRRRGGYCFEQNTLWLAVLHAIGFDARSCDARVRVGDPATVRPRTHMAVIVTLGDTQYLTDVGFGPQGPLGPVPLDDGAHEAAGRRFRVVSTPGVAAVLQTWVAGGWTDLYASDLTPCHPADLAMANWFTSTWPQSPFVTSLVAQRTLRNGSHVLRNLTYTHVDGHASATREIARVELVQTLGEVFGLVVPADARFIAIDGEAGLRS